MFANDYQRLQLFFAWLLSPYYPNSQLFTRFQFRKLLTINEKRKPSSDFLFDLKAEEVHSVLNDMQIKKLEHRLSDIEIGHGIIRALSQKRHVTHPKIIKLQFPVRSMAMSLAVDLATWLKRRRASPKRWLPVLAAMRLLWSSFTLCEA